MKPRFGFSHKPAPTVCPDCLSTLLAPEYDGQKGWSVRCPRCGCYLQWTWPRIWQRRHKLPLFDMDRRTISES